MGKHSHRKHSVGMNDSHELSILGAVQGVNGLEPDFALRRVTGTRESVRKSAQAVVDKFLRDGGELRLPELDVQPVNPGTFALVETVINID